MAGKSDTKKSFDATAFLDTFVPSAATNPEMMAAAESLQKKQAEQRHQQLQNLIESIGSRHNVLLNSLRNLRAAADKAEVVLKADMELLKSKLEDFVTGKATADDVSAVVRLNTLQMSDHDVSSAVSTLNRVRKTVVLKD
jgi:hypothetical protein